MTQKELPLVTCSGTPREMGRQYGEQAASAIACNISSFAIQRDQTMLCAMQRTLDKYAPEILEELEGMAEGSGIDFELLLSYNHWELASAEGERCTVLLLHSRDAGLLVAKNNDSPPDEDGKFLIRQGKRSNGLPFTQVTYAGLLSGLDMANAAGLCNTHGSVGSCFARTGDRLDIRLRLYQLMQTCQTVDELLSGLKAVPLTGKGFSIGMGDKSGHSLILDAAVPFLGERDENKTFTFSTNLYEYPGLENADRRLPASRHICLFRNGFLKWQAQTEPPETLDDLQKITSSHAPWALCRHGGVHSSITDWSVIFQPQRGKALVAHGSPCRTPYREISL